jgi:hypothetical protein
MAETRVDNSIYSNLQKAKMRYLILVFFMMLIILEVLQVIVEILKGTNYNRKVDGLN